MFCIVDSEKNFAPVKSGFKTASQANSWAKKNLPKDECILWGVKHKNKKWGCRYFIKMKCN